MEKHRLRQHFHLQLAQLWRQLPLRNYPKLLDPTRLPGELSVLRNLGPYLFAPLVAERLHMVAELGITMLRPEAPGRIVTQAGDIDNRLKTLLDSLKMLGEPGELPPQVGPSANETPFFCLLEDDNLITALTVRTDRLLEPAGSPGEVELTVHGQIARYAHWQHRVGVAMFSRTSNYSMNPPTGGTLVLFISVGRTPAAGYAGR